MQFVTLLYAMPITPDYSAVLSKTAEHLGEEVQSSPLERSDEAFSLFYPLHASDFAEGKLPAQTAFLSMPKPKLGNQYEEQIQQSWGFPDAQVAVESASHALVITEMMARSLEPLVRLKLFHAALEAAIEITKPQAIVFGHSCEVVDPVKYLQAATRPAELRPGAFNVRFFKIEGSKGEMVMDIRGLEALDLPDLQCHFTALDPNEVARVLHNTAIYIAQNGPVIKSGQTVEGSPPGAKWLCQYEQSMLKPNRTVLDINPGSGFGAGRRGA